MKKLLSWLICAVLLLSISAVCAEESAESEIVPAFEVIVSVPEGYTLEGPVYHTPYICGSQYKPQSEDRPTLALVVSYNDSASDITFNDDMSEADLESYINKVGEDPESGEVVPYTIQKTGLGTKVAVFSHPEGAIEYYSIWHGYEVSLYAYNGDPEGELKPITDEQNDAIMAFLTEMDFAKLIVETEE